MSDGKSVLNRGKNYFQGCAGKKRWMLGTRQWPEVSDFVAHCANSVRFLDGRGFLVLAQRAKSDTNHIPWATAYFALAMGIERSNERTVFRGQCKTTW